MKSKLIVKSMCSIERTGAFFFKLTQRKFSEWKLWRKKKLFMSCAPHLFMICLRYAMHYMQLHEKEKKMKA